MNDQDLYLGVIDWAGDTVRGPIAQLLPLCRSTPDLLSWQPIEDSGHSFPNQGYVTWFNPSTRFRGTPWVFRLEFQPTFLPDIPTHDRYRVLRTAEAALEVVDLRGLGDVDQVRRVLTEEGLLLRYVPSQSAYLWTEEETWVGPVQLVRDEASGYWFLEESQTTTPLKCFSPLEGSKLVAIHLEHDRMFLVPGAKPGPSRGLVDWAPDNVLLKRVLRTLRKRDRSYTDALGLTERVLDRTAELVSTAGLSRLDSALEISRLQRARAILMTLNERQELIDEVADDLMEVPAITAKTTAAVALASEKASAQIRTQLSQEITRRDQVKSQTEAAEGRLREIERLVDLRRAELESQVVEFDRLLSMRLSNLMSRPEQELANIAIVRAALMLDGNARNQNSEGTKNAASTPTAYVPQAPWGRTSDSLLHLTDSSAFRKTIRQALRSRGIAVGVATPLHAAFLCGTVPVLAGSRAFEAFEAYANHVAGGRLVWLPVPPTALEPADLLGRVDSATRRFVPHPSGLLDVLLAAVNSDDLHMVILDGFNRSAVDAYLAPLLACYFDAWRTGPKRELPLVHPAAVDSREGAVFPSRLAWPRNVLLALVLNEGIAAIPPTPAFWTKACLVHMERFAQEDEAPYSCEDGLTDVPLTVWRAWRDTAESSDSTPIISLLESLTCSGLTMNREVLGNCQRFYKAARTWADEVSAIECTIVHCLVPQIKQEHDGLFFSALSDAGHHAETVEEAVRLLRESLS